MEIAFPDQWNADIAIRGAAIKEIVDGGRVEKGKVGCYDQDFLSRLRLIHKLLETAVNVFWPCVTRWEAIGGFLAVIRLGYFIWTDDDSASDPVRVFKDVERMAENRLSVQEDERLVIGAYLCRKLGIDPSSRRENGVIGRHEEQYRILGPGLEGGSEIT